MSRKKVTSSDVAKRAGVSQATVSMVLNKKYNVSFSKEVIQNVEQAAEELGYVLPKRKVQREERREKLLVVISPNLTNPYYVMLLQGIESRATEQGYGIFVCNTQRDQISIPRELFISAIRVNVLWEKWKNCPKRSRWLLLITRMRS